MLGNRRILRCVALLAVIFFSGFAVAEQCTAIFPGGIQSHSPSGFIQMGYMSRVHGSGPTLTAPSVRHTHDWQNQVGLCDDVKCTASGTPASTQNVDFLAGTEVPELFELSTSNNNVSNGYNAGVLALPAADYGTVSVGQESTVRFFTVGGTYRTKTITTNYKSIIEFQPGTYWINGNLNWTAQDTRIRRLSGSGGLVTLYVSGNVNIGQAHLEGFSEGQIRIYAKGDVTAGNDFIFPGEIHAGGQVGFGERAKITGGIYSGNFSTGNGAVVRYTRQNYDHKMGALNPAYNSTFELSPGNYWIDGGFDASVASTFRKVGGSGVVRLFVSGNINVQHDASFEGFSGGDLVMYSTGKITLTSQTDLPAFVYAVGDVEINFSQGARYRGGITGRNVYIGQNSIVQYLDPVDLGPLCDSGGGQGPVDPVDPVDPVECGVSLEVDHMIAGQPHVATINFLTADPDSEEPLSCERPSKLKILFEYLSPDPGYHKPEPIKINSISVAERESIELNIDEKIERISLDIEYNEVGRLRLTLLGGVDDEPLHYDDFVSRPYGFCIKPLQEAPIEEDGSPESIDFSSAVRFKAGDPFPVSITAVRWDSGNGGSYGSVENPLLAKDICGNTPTQNYRQAESTIFKAIPKLIQPVEHGEPGKVVGSFRHLSSDNNFVPGTAIANVVLDEVGFFRIQMEEPPQYLDEDMSASISQSKIIGRITPAYFSFEDPEVTLGCGSFTYAGLLEKTEPAPQLEKKGQSFSVSGKLSALNRAGKVTQNYKDDFAKLTVNGISYVDSRDALNKVVFDDTFVEEEVDERGDRYFSYGSNLYFLFDAPAEPYKLAMQVNAKDEDEVEGSVVDRVMGAEGNADYLLPEFRLGIARLSHAHGSELQDLSLTFTTAYFDGSSYVPNGQDNCSVLAYSSLTDVVSLKGVLENDTEVINNGSPLEVQQGIGQILLKAPVDGKTGSVTVAPTLEGAEWLKYDWDGDGNLKAPTGLATFGIYKGPKPLIFRRELYRGM